MGPTADHDGTIILHSDFFEPIFTIISIYVIFGKCDNKIVNGNNAALKLKQ